MVKHFYVQILLRLEVLPGTGETEDLVLDVSVKSSNVY